MDAKDMLIKLLYGKLSRNGFKPNDFVLEYKNGLCTVCTLNKYHTILLKIQVESEVESVPLLLSAHEIIENTFNYKSLAAFDKYDVNYYNIVNKFREDMANKVGYSECSYDDLNKIFKAFPDGSLSINSRGDYSVVSNRLLKSVFLEKPTLGEVFLKINQDRPCFVAYDCYCFRVDAAVAPRVTDKWNADVILRLKE